MKQVIYQSMVDKKRKGLKSFSVLVDPDKVNHLVLDELINCCVEAEVDYLLVGGSLVISNYLDECVQHIKKLRYSGDLIPRKHITGFPVCRCSSISFHDIRAKS